MSKKYDVPSDLSIDQLGLTLEDMRAWKLDELAHNSARLILEIALREEVLDLLGRTRWNGSSSSTANGSRWHARHYAGTCTTA